MATSNKSGKTNEELMTPLTNLINKGRREGVLASSEVLAALEKLSADETAQTVLRLYDGDGVRYGGADTQAVEFAQYLLGNTEGVYQLTSE